MANNDDELTPADTPRAKKSSITIATAELLAERVAILLNKSPLTDALREQIGETLADWARQQVARVLKLEREEYAKVRQELAETQRERNKLASLLSRTP